MLCSWKIVLIPLLLTGFVVADTTDDDIDYEEIHKIIRMVEEKQTTPETAEQPEPETMHVPHQHNTDLNLPHDVAIQLVSLRTHVTTALSVIQQQGEAFVNLIDVYLNQTKIVRENKMCGKERVCVKKNLCKSEPVDGNGHVMYRFRNFGNEPCNYLQTCCHIIDTIEEIPEASDKNQPSICGKRNVNGLKGTLDAKPNMEAQFGEFPWMVAIMWNTKLIAGGSIIAPNVVVTAATRVQNHTLKEIKVRAGDWNLESLDEPIPHLDRNVMQLILHERYSFNERSNDIALIILDKPFSKQPNIAPICLPTHNENFDFQDCVVTGWGKRDERSEGLSNVLKEIPLRVLPNSQCNDLLTKATGYHVVRLHSSTICAGGEEGLDACFGDGGAPLACPIKGSPNRYKLAGIVAWGIGCGRKNVPGVYTNVAAFTPWISDQLRSLNIESKYYTA
ncbi:phenoloxidase-activating factor 2-like isoform X6 [Drosophila albomicans]|uniref:Phenoloxidase-activating factor 2 n=1 Tax=Drosophila albomicans TaxID=7291 RepID=A0A9C6SKZ9_DROAB|nr:phenoloxidase-activating factor 2-like isoform X6 [Drosophila albomicans]